MWIVGKFINKLSKLESRVATIYNPNKIYTGIGSVSLLLNKCPIARAPSSFSSYPGRVLQRWYQAQIFGNFLSIGNPQCWN